MSNDQPAPDPLDTDPLTDDDLAVDAVADGTATSAQREAVDADAILRGRADGLVALRSALAGPIAPLPPETADRMIATALEAVSDPSAPRHATGPADRTATPSARSDRTRWLVAAAVAVLVALGAVTLPRLTAGRGENNDTAASSATIASTTAPGAGSAGADRSSDQTPTASGVPSAAQDSTADALLVPLGESTTVEEIVVRALTALDGQRAGAPDPIAPENATINDSAPARACLARLPTDGSVELTASGSIAGIDHLVLVTTSSTAPPTLVLEVVRVEDCTIVERVVR